MKTEEALNILNTFKRRIKEKALYEAIDMAHEALTFKGAEEKLRKLMEVKLIEGK